MWKSVPGALEWLASYTMHIHQQVPDKATLLTLLNSSTSPLLLYIRCANSNPLANVDHIDFDDTPLISQASAGVIIRPPDRIRQVYCTRHMKHMLGSKAPGFSLPPDFEQVDGDEVWCYVLTEGWERDGFYRISCSSIVHVPCWKQRAQLDSQRLQEVLEKKASDSRRFCGPCLLRLRGDTFDYSLNTEEEEGEEEGEGEGEDSKKEKILGKYSTTCGACKNTRFANKLCSVCCEPARQRCGRCMKSIYCSKEHQNWDWKRGRHKFICQSKRDRIRCISPLTQLLYEGKSQLAHLIFMFVVGSDMPVQHERSALSLIALSRTCKQMRASLQLLHLWKSLGFWVDLSEVDDGGYSINEDEEEEEEEIGERWPVLKLHSTEVIRTYVMYGGNRIIDLHLQLRNVSDKALEIVSTHCQCLKTVGLVFTTFCNCRFYTTEGLANFFRTVVPLTCLLLYFFRVVCFCEFGSQSIFAVEKGGLGELFLGCYLQ
jgi:hypothetical protein